MHKLADRQRSRWLHWLLGCWVFIAAAGLLPATATPVLAQDGDKTEETASQDMFSHIIKSAGIVFGPILLLVSIGLVTLIVLLAMDLRMGHSIPPAFVDDFADIVNKRKFKEAFDLCKSDGSFLARVLTAGMGRLQYGIEDAREAAFNMVDSIRSSKEQLTNYLGTIGTLGPMIGLVGTVYGMIQSFMALSAGGTPKSEELAKGISHALVVTLLGVAISVPAIFFYTLFRNRLIRITMDTSNLADDLLTQIYHNSKKVAADARATAAPPADPRVK
jgi:biopolymer transport protein ExbB